MDHSMSLYEVPFNSVKSGRKGIEVRLYDEKRQLIRVGDTITFYKLPGKEECVIVKVMRLSMFDSFFDLYSCFDKSMFDHPTHYTVEDQVRRERQYYSEEKEKKYGVVGIHIELSR